MASGDTSVKCRVCVYGTPDKRGKSRVMCAPPGLYPEWIEDPDNGSCTIGKLRHEWLAEDAPE